MRGKKTAERFSLWELACPCIRRSGRRIDERVYLLILQAVCGDPPLPCYEAEQPNAARRVGV